MVSGAGGSWWQRFRSRGVKRDAVCSFCGLPPSDFCSKKSAAGREIAAAAEASVCAECLALCRQFVDGAGA